MILLAEFATQTALGADFPFLPWGLSDSPASLVLGGIIVLVVLVSVLNPTRSRSRSNQARAIQNLPCPFISESGTGGEVP